VGNAPLDRIRVITDRYRQTWVAAGHDLHDIPLMGTTRHIVIGRNEQEAHRWAREAYSHWHRSFMHLWNVHGTRPGNVFPADWDELVAAGRALAGTPESVREELLHQIEVSGVNFILTRFAFGTLPFEQSLQSVELFAQEVMPYITERVAIPQVQ
jgi:alkanesulfonate monooxygenase SsuD/methylene tetrahydromethanopterin reductase-like flavin-dependent oxidoreductase (luciferase family)